MAEPVLIVRGKNAARGFGFSQHASRNRMRAARPHPPASSDSVRFQLPPAPGGGRLAHPFTKEA